MGQKALCRGQCSSVHSQERAYQLKSFPDLVTLPPELAVEVLSHLDATDLCLASCVNELWWSLANVDPLWKKLCYNRWGKVSAYNTPFPLQHSYKTLYMILDDGTLTFTADPQEGVAYLIGKGVLEDSPSAIADFINHTTSLDWKSLSQFLQTRPDVLTELISQHSYADVFLPDALRKFFSLIPAPDKRGEFLEKLLEMFSQRYLQCNPGLCMDKDTVFVICYSLIMLSVDLISPHVKNKMSKREFIRNLRQAAGGISDDTLGHMYDNVYLTGHVATDY